MYTYICGKCQCSKYQTLLFSAQASVAAAAPSGGGEKPEEDENDDAGRKESAEKVGGGKKVSFNNGECVRGETDNGENGK